MSSHRDFEVYKCKTLIKMLKKRKQKPERAMERYSKKIYLRAIKEVGND
jgi:hypothetical protein